MHEAPDFKPEENLRSVMALTIPVWAVWSVVVFFVLGTFYFVTLLNTINGKLDSVGADRWKRSHMREFVHRMQEQNDGKIKLPDPDQIAKDLE
jgi:hypothetical protein